MTQHVVLVVDGKVQGVFYRASTKEKADEIGIAGVVQNLPDGKVYIEAEGSEEQLERFKSWCRQGPPRAAVSSLDEQYGEVKNYSGFRVVR